MSLISALGPVHNKKRRKAVNVVAGSLATASLVVASQAIYVGLTTPRLKAPPKSCHDFDKDGLLVDVDEVLCMADNHSTPLNVSNHRQTFQNQDEIRVVLLGDSPVEGIGNETHDESMSGQTAHAIMRTFHKPVRYWSLGKSGLTAKEIQIEMVSLMKNNVLPKYKIDLIVISCGVNNVLRGQSAKTFAKELDSLLDSIDDCNDIDYNVPVIVLGLLDFSHLPFLPFPLSSVAGWRSRVLHQEMIEIVNKRSTTSQRIFEMAHIPSVHTIVGNDNHPLLDCVSKIPRGNTSELDDFFADDGFHPAKYGTIMLGNLIASTMKCIFE